MPFVLSFFIPVFNCLLICFRDFFAFQIVINGIILITGSVMALMMFWEMIQTLREGKYGVDILAITAIVATLAVGEYWASLMILIMLTGGDSLTPLQNLLLK